MDTSNNTNKVTATPTDENATVVITLGESQIQNGTSATWAVGENVLTITVTNGTSETIYIVTVTKS